MLNAIAHRSMIVQNDVFIKPCPKELTITNAGGFPIGVDKSNVLTVNSTPRSKRLAEVLQKMGLVEKSGQGVIFEHGFALIGRMGFAAGS